MASCTGLATPLFGPTALTDILENAAGRTVGRANNRMRQTFEKLITCLALAAITAFAQTKPSFEVATIKPVQPMDPTKMLAAFQSGGKMPVGANIGAGRAE